MEITHGKILDELKVKVINKILNNLTFNQHSISDPRYGIDIQSDIKYMTLKIINAETGIYAGFGLCPALNIYLLRKLYNEAISEKYEKFLGQVYVASRDPEIASKCYIRSYKALGFDFIGKKKRENSYGFDLFFKKNKPKEGWKKIDQDLVYDRLNIRYIIKINKIIAYVK